MRDEVRLGGAHDFQSLANVVCLPADRHPEILADEECEPLAKHRVIFHEQDLDFFVS